MGRLAFGRSNKVWPITRSYQKHHKKNSMEKVLTHHQKYVSKAFFDSNTLE